MSAAHPSPPGLKAFLPIWFGQLVSYTGTGMTRFAVTVWAFQTTGSAESLAWVAFFSFVPIMLMTPFAGVLTDRWNRKLVLMLSDAGAALASGMIVLLYVTGNLQVWHLMVAGVIGGLFEAFQWPAMSASVTQLVPKEQYARANGLLSLADWSSRIVAPLLAGLLLPLIGLGGILLVDIATCAVAVLAVFLSTIPQPKPEPSTGGKVNLFNDAGYGFVYIWRNASLLAIVIFYFLMNFFGDFWWILMPPMILSRTANDTHALGLVEAAAGVGGVVGGVALSVWGGPRRKIDAVLRGFIMGALAGTIVVAIGRTVPVWMIGAFFAVVVFPIVNGSAQAIWQAKVPVDLQGRAFAARRVTAQVSAPLGMISAGVLADRIFEPLMQNPDSALAQLFGGVVGVGAGSGMALMILIAGMASIVIAIVAYTIPAIRDVETLLSDAQEFPASDQAIDDVNLASESVAV